MQNQSKREITFDTQLKTALSNDKSIFISILSRSLDVFQFTRYNLSAKRRTSFFLWYSATG